VRLGLISDIHGNAVALEAVIAELERAGVDRIVCLGDVAIGPQPRETIARVRELGCPVIMGNWDAYFLGARPEPDDEVAAMLGSIAAWGAALLSPDERAWMAAFPPRVEVELDGTNVLCFHGSPRSYDDWILATTPDGEVARMFDGCEAPLMTGGHTHVQLLRRHERWTLVNPGSVGLAFRRWWPSEIRIAPWAEYAVVDDDGGRLAVELQRTAFDVDRFLELSAASGMPHADWWAGCWDRA
jgi:putative phosphoesterase